MPVHSDRAQFLREPGSDVESALASLLPAQPGGHPASAGPGGPVTSIAT